MIRQTILANGTAALATPFCALTFGWIWGPWAILTAVPEQQTGLCAAIHVAAAWPVVAAAPCCLIKPGPTCLPGRIQI